jgi:biopolymer transport protein ExbB
MLAIIEGAGWPIWPLIATSFLALALIVERLLSLRRAVVVPSGLLDEVLALARRRQLAPDVIPRLQAHSPLGRILAAGLRYRHLPREPLKAAIEDTGRSVAHGLNRYVGALGTIASVAPLMGLFGTVVGMIEIFGAWSPTGGDPVQLARGISIALYNTGLGILIAIPALVCYRLFRARIASYVHDMEQAALRLVDAFQTDEGA